MAKRSKKRLTKRAAQKARATIATLVASFAGFTVELTAEERKRRLRIRPGGEVMIEHVLIAAERAGLVHPTSTADVRASMELLHALEPIAQDLRHFLDLVEGTMLQCQHDAWGGSTGYYRTLRRLAGANREIEAAIAPVVEFFAIGPRSKEDGAPRTPPEPLQDADSAETA
jgi:hypothetical protein